MRTRLLGIIKVTLVSLGSAASSFALDSNWTITGQVRPRMEIRNGYRVLPTDHTDDGVMFISQRSRLGIAYSSDPRLMLTLIVQDVRTWGDELNTTSDYSANNFDIYRAFVDLKPDSQWTLRIGRQGIGYDEERILGDADWSQQGRAHDAVRVMWDNGRQAVHAGWAHHEQGEPTRHVTYTITSNYQDLAFVWLQTREKNSSASALIVYDDYELYGTSMTPGVPTQRWTAGAFLQSRKGDTHGRVEAYWQTGARETITDEADINAYMFGIELDQSIGKSSVMLWYDYLSGDDKPLDDKSTVFDPTYHTGHRNYGWADYFTNIPIDTYGRGLQDFALKLKTPLAGTSVLDIHFHYFVLAEPFETFQGKDKSALGFEADMMATIPLMKNVRLLGGYSLITPTQFAKDITGGDSPGHWLWTMLDVNVK